MWAIVLGAGASARFDGQPKQFVRVRGRTLLDRAVDAALAASAGAVAVIPPGRDWARPGVAAVAGGRTRAASVRAGLAAVPATAEIVVIHDAAHPLAGSTLFAAVIDAVRDGADAAVPGLPVTEVLRTVEDGAMVADLPRAGVVLVQMPQAFRAPVLRAAHTNEPDTVEDSWLVRTSGGTVRVVAGDPRNIHVTTRAELDLVRCIAAVEG